MSLFLLFRYIQLVLSFSLFLTAGIDVGYNIKREAARKAGVELKKDSRFFLGERNCGLGEKLYEAGRMGKKNGEDFLDYGLTFCCMK